MWIFFPNAFLSIVEDKQRPSHLLVRGRFAGDIQNVFPSAKVSKNPDRDYLYRASIPRDDVADAVAIAVEQIDYHNFKDEATDSRPKKKRKGGITRRSWHDILLRIWTLLYSEQEHPTVPAPRYEAYHQIYDSLDAWERERWPVEEYR